MGRRPAARRLLTVLFTDIVGSTELAVELEDRRWRALLARHHELVRRQLRRFRGREIDTAGDGFLATFEQPEAAIRCAWAITDAVRNIGLEVRAGIHTGEVEMADRKVGGIAVHTAARILGLAGPGEVLVSGTLRELAAGSGIRFEDREEHLLKGVPGTWRVFAVIDIDRTPRSPAVEPDVAAQRRTTASEPPPRRPCAAALVAAALALAVGAGVLVLAIDEEPSQPSPGNLGGIVLNLDATNERILRTIPLRGVAPPNQPADIAAGEGGLWVIRFPRDLGDGGNIVARMDRETGVVTETTPVQESQGTIRVAIGARAVWVLSYDPSGSGSHVTQVNPATGEILTRVSFGGPEGIGGGPPGFDFPAGLSIGEGAVWVATNGGTLVQIDAVDNGVLESSDVASSSHGVSAGEGAVWLIDDLADTLIRVDPRTMRTTASIPLPGDPEFLAVGEGAVWIADVTNGTVQRVDAATGEPGQSIRVGTNPTDMVVAFGAVWVVNEGDRTLTRIDPVTDRAETIELNGLSPTSISADDVTETLWVWGR